MRRFYATPRFFEPWQTVAQEAADTVHDGGLIVGNNPSFFFYLTYALSVPESPSGFHLEGVLTQGIQNPQVWESSAWEQADRPLRPNVLWVFGMPGPEEGTTMGTARQWLDAHCEARNARYLARDPSYPAKQRFAPQIPQLLWRVEIHSYRCESVAATP